MAVISEMRTSSGSTDSGRVVVRMAEWETRNPTHAGPGAALRGLSLGPDLLLAGQAAALAKAGVVSLTELRDGLRIETFSFVGRIALGQLDLVVQPKVAWSRWVHLFGLAVGLRDVTRTADVAAQLAPSSLHDLVVLELVKEARHLLSRGLHKEYERERRALAVPRGRIDFASIARVGLRSAAIPSRFTRRVDDTILNRVLLGGLLAAGRIASDPSLRAMARRLAQELGDFVTPPVLSLRLLRDTRDALDRRTSRYERIIRLTELLLIGSAVALEEEGSGGRLAIPGFALDMNRLWQRLLGRLLTEWAPTLNVRQEVSLRQLFRRDAAFSPRPRRVPLPRPDFAVNVPGRGVVYLDAKYRDLWATSLPREMLYQLALYASAQPNGVAAMLYPTEATEAAEERLQICNPGSGETNATVALRPVNIVRLEELVRAPASPFRDREREAFAQQLVEMGTP